MIPHGTPSGYIRHKCRCEDCRDAKNVAQHRWRAKRRGEVAPLYQPPPADPEALAAHATQAERRSGITECRHCGEPHYTLTGCSWCPEPAAYPPQFLRLEA